MVDIVLFSLFCSLFGFICNIIRFQPIYGFTILTQSFLLWVSWKLLLFVDKYVYRWVCVVFWFECPFPSLILCFSSFLDLFSLLLYFFSCFWCVVRLEIWTRLIIENNFYDRSHLSFPLRFFDFFWIRVWCFKSRFEAAQKQKVWYCLSWRVLVRVEYIRVYDKILTSFIYHFYIWFWLVRYFLFFFPKFSSPV